MTNGSDVGMGEYVFKLGRVLGSMPVAVMGKTENIFDHPFLLLKFVADSKVMPRHGRFIEKAPRRFPINNPITCSGGALAHDRWFI